MDCQLRCHTSGEAEPSSSSLVEQEEMEGVDEDEQSSPTPERCDEKKRPPPLLREVDTDGNKKVISDHSTSAGFSFHNSLMYELD